MHLTYLKIVWSNNKSYFNSSFSAFCVGLAREKNTSALTLMFQLSLEVSWLNPVPVYLSGPLCGLSYVLPQISLAC